MSTPVEVIKKFVKALINTDKQGTDAVDVAFKAVGAVNYDVFKSKFSDAQSGLSTEDFLEQKCGIRVNNKDTSAITGSDAGGKATKTAESIVPETAKAVSLTKAQYNSFTKNGLKVNVTYNEVSDTDAGENFGYSAKTYLDKQKLVVRALYNWWIPESLNLINESLGINFTDGRASINEINIEFTNELESYRDVEYATSLEFSYDMGLASVATLYINSDLLYKITANDKNGTLDGNKGIYSDFYAMFKMWMMNNDDRTIDFSNYLDRIILQSLAEVTIKSNVSYAYYLPQIITAGLCEVVGGFDNQDGYTDYGLESYVKKFDSIMMESPYGYALMRYLAKNYSDGMPDGLSYSKNKTVLTATTAFTEGTIDLANFASTVKTVNASALKTKVKIVGNALANSIKSGAGNDTLYGEAGNDTIYGGAGNDYIYGGVGDDKLYGEAGNDTLYGEAGNDTINGGAGNDKIYGGAGNDKLYGEAGNDTLRGNAGNDTLTGGKGNDVFIYTEGKDVIADYATGDKISLGASISKSTVSSTDVILTIGKKGTLTIKNGADKKLSMINAKGKAFETVISGKTELTVTNKTSSPVTAEPSIKVINATKRTTAIQITGNDRDNTISGGSNNDTINGAGGNDYLLGNAGNDKIYGGTGDDNIWGGKGNDSLWGNAGKDTFVYMNGDGKDIIYGFDDNDLLQIMDDFTPSYKDKAVILTVGSGSITLKDFNASTFHINSDAYKISGSTLKKQ